MKVEVRELTNWPVDMPVVIKDEDEQIIWCNHAQTELDQRDFGYADTFSCDWVDDWHEVEVCSRCNAWRTLDDDSEWIKE